jgi:hypothetical protein
LPGLSLIGREVKFLAPYTHELRDVPRCGALMQHKPLHYRGDSAEVATKTGYKIC